MRSIRDAGAAGAAYVRSRVRRAADTEPTSDRPADTPATPDPREAARRSERLREMYEHLRRTYRVKVPEVDEGLPEPDDVGAVETAAANGNEVYASFFSTVGMDGDLNRALMTFHRRMIRLAKEPGRARAIAQVMQNNDQLRPVADLCLAVSALREPVPNTSWTLFSRNDLALVLRFAPVEYFRCGIELGFGPQTAASALDKVAAGEVPMTAEAPTWIDVALIAFAGGFEKQSAYALERAEAALSEISDSGRLATLRHRIASQREWYGRTDAIAQARPMPAGTIPFALVGYRHPDPNLSSDRATDMIESLTVLGQLARHSGVRFTGDDGLGEVADDLRTRLPASSRIAGESGDVHLLEIDRDLSEFSVLPDETWTILSSWFTHPLSDARFAAPLHPRLRPIFLGFHIEEPALSRAGVVEYLRRHAPIGCLDWATVQLLQAADVPAFFSGALAATAGDVVGSGDEPAGGGGQVAWFDLPPEGVGRRRHLAWSAIPSRSLAENLREADQTLRRWRSSIARAVTRDLRFSLAARSLGFEVEYRPQRTDLSEIHDLGRLADADFDRMRRGIDEKLAAVLGAVLAGQPAEQVYARWREVCAADVAEAEAVRTSVPDLPAVDFDLRRLCDGIRAASVTVDRTEQVGHGEELNIEFSLDANYKPKLDVVLDSVVAHTDRPVRAFVLCREHGPEDFERMARLFPMVSFVWLPTDDVDYGPIAGKVPWASLATMDRTLLPLLLPDVDKIMHLDLDLLVLGDLAEFFDTPNEGRPLVAILEPQLCFLSGYDTIRRTAHRLRAEGRPELAVELMARVVQRHPFDFEVFNAGVLLMNLDRMRADDFCARFLPYVQRYGVNGQEVLNIYVGDDYVRRDRRWNLNIRLEVPEDARIVHWAGPFKPWRRTWYVTGRELWAAAEQRFRARTAGLEREASAATAATPGPAE